MYFEAGFNDWNKLWHHIVTMFSKESLILVTLVWDRPKVVSPNTYETSSIKTCKMEWSDNG
jgi:hypothetical protein